MAPEAMSAEPQDVHRVADSGGSHWVRAAHGWRLADYGIWDHGWNDILLCYGPLTEVPDDPK